MEWLLKGVGRPVKHRTVTHVVTDAMTVSGGRSRLTQIGASTCSAAVFALGSRLEYGISACVVSACIGLNSLVPQGEFAPFFYDWPGIMRPGRIDAAE